MTRSKSVKVGRVLLLGTVVVNSWIGCSPKFYLIDRQTILEEEAAGEWPEFEKELLEKTAAKSATPFPKVDTSSSRGRLYHVLNGEFESQPPSKSTPKPGQE